MAKRQWRLAWLKGDDSSCQNGPTFTPFSLQHFVVRLLVCLITINAASPQATSTSFTDFYFTSEPQDVIASKGQPLMLNCSAYHPTQIPDIRWMFNSQAIRFDQDRRRYKLQNGSLYFNTIEHSRGEGAQTDKGVYQCVATVTNLGTILSRPASLRVAHMAKVFDAEPTKFTPALYLGDTAIFRCSIKGEPTPTITWYRDNTRILPSSNVHTYYDGLLEISELQFRDFASYQCEARTSDRVRKSRAITIRQNPDSDVVYQRVAPKFVVNPTDTSPIQGTNAILHCAANGRDSQNTQPQITWLKDGVTINFKSEPRYSIIGTGALRIITVREGDSGTYTCRAQNAEDSVDSDAKLKVLVPPTITTKPNDTIGIQKSDILLQCEGYGIPHPKVSWRKDGNLINFNSYFQLVDGRSLRILGLMKSDAGFYQCFVGNQLGTIHADAQLVVVKPASSTSPSLSSGQSLVDKAQLPTSPMALTAPIVSTRFVTLSWQPPKYMGYSPVSSYRVFWNEDGSQRERVMNTTTLDANIQHLKPSTKYHFRIQSFNSRGGSLSHASVTLTTQKEVLVPGASQNLVATTLSSESIELTWSPPKQRNGHITQYDLFYYKTSDTKEHKTTVKTTSYVLSNLEPYNTYSFRVVAYNENGPGVNSEDVEAETYSDKPTGSPVNVTLEVSSTTSLIVRWDPPEFDNRNGVITGYKIRHKKRGMRRGKSVTTDGNRRTFALTDLEKDKEYVVRISALNVNGSGPLTEWLSAKTLRDDLDESRVPGQPTKLRARSLANSIIVTWSHPSDTSVMVRGYTLGYGKGIPDVYEVHVDAKKLYYTIENVAPVTEYVISVKAHNKIGSGRSKMETVITIEEPAPEPTTPMVPPVGLKAIVLSAKTIVLTWTDSSLGAQRITDNRYYTVRYKAKQRKSRFKYINCTDLVAHIDELKPNTPYSFEVKVIKGQRQSTWSMSAENTTWEFAPGSIPRDLTPEPLDDTTVMLSWQPPLRSNGLISGYLVYYTMDSTLKDADWVLDGVLGDKLSIRLPNLSPDTTYHFKVQARNKKGFGPMSPTVVYRTAKEDGTGGEVVNIPQTNDGDPNGPPTLPIGWKRTNKPHEPNETENNEEKKGGLPTNVLIIIIACVIGITFIIVTVIVVVVLCRRRVESDERKNRPNIVYKTPAKAIPKDQNPPDLWIVGEKCQGGGEGPASIPPSSRNSQEVKSIDDMPPGMELLERRRNSFVKVKSIDDMPPGMELLERRRNSFVSDQSYDPPKQEDRYVRPTPVRPKPMMIPVDGQMHREPIATVTALPNGHLIQNIPPDSVPVRPVYPRTQYNTQYTTPPRVHAGDVSQPSSIGYHDEDGGGVMEDAAFVGRNVGYGPDSSPYMRSTGYENPQSPTSSGSNSCNEGYRSLPKTRAFAKNLSSSGHTPPSGTKSSHIPKHIVKPQQPASPFKKPNPPVASTPAKSRSPKPPVSGHKEEKKCRDDMQKSMSTEELSAEMANLEVLMKDLNDITQQEFQC